MSKTIPCLMPRCHGKWVSKVCCSRSFASCKFVLKNKLLRWFLPRPILRVNLFAVLSAPRWLQCSCKYSLTAIDYSIIYSVSLSVSIYPSLLFFSYTKLHLVMLSHVRVSFCTAFWLNPECLPLASAIPYRSSQGSGTLCIFVQQLCICPSGFAETGHRPNFMSVAFWMEAHQ